jgi:hypothetical protein
MVDGSTSRSFPSRALHLALVSCVVLVGWLVLSGPQALAAGSPEAPIMQCHPLGIGAGGPFVCGTLNPHSKEKLTDAYLTFSAGSTCTGGTQVSVEGFTGQGEEDIEVQAKPEGLAPGTEYAFCLVAVNSVGETVSDPLTFTTTAEPKSELATAVASTSAMLEGTLEPAGAKLKYQFYYSGGPTCEGGVPTAQAEGEGKVSAQVEGLASNTEYTFCLQAKGNEEGFIFPGETNVGTATGKQVQFKTLETQVEKEAWFKTFAEENAKQVAEEAAVRMRHEEEATAAAARKHQEEAAAASHKREEEAAPKKKKEAEPPATGGIALAATSVTVQSEDVALVKLNCLGIASCHGRLTLTAKIAAKGKGKGKKQPARTVRIGTASVSIAGDETKTEKIKLSSSGDARLIAHNGRLSASLEILELAPSPKNTQTKTVQLVQQKAHGKTKKGSPA